MIGHCLDIRSHWPTLCRYRRTYDPSGWQLVIHSPKIKIPFYSEPSLIDHVKNWSSGVVATHYTSPKFSCTAGSSLLLNGAHCPRNDKSTYEFKDLTMLQFLSKKLSSPHQNCAVCAVHTYIQSRLSGSHMNWPVLYCQNVLQHSFMWQMSSSWFTLEEMVPLENYKFASKNNSFNILCLSDAKDVQDKQLDVQQ